MVVMTSAALHKYGAATVSVADTTLTALPRTYALTPRLGLAGLHGGSSGVVWGAHPKTSSWLPVFQLWIGRTITTTATARGWLPSPSSPRWRSRDDAYWWRAKPSTANPPAVAVIEQLAEAVFRRSP